MGDVSPLAPVDVPAPQTGSLAGAPEVAPGGAPQVAPSGFGHTESQTGPSVALAQYDPHTGGYIAPDGEIYRQSDLVAPASPAKSKSWKDMFAT